jgi:threonine dehydrogenase-like Zn-dependent dehydrogenase
MRGLTFPGGRDVALVDFPDPTPGSGEVVVEIKASGMCGSDLHFYRRPKGAPLAVRHHFHEGPVICGHEPCGVIAALGPNVPAGIGKVGDRVMVYHYAACGVCNHCRAGWQQHCTDVPLHVYGNNDHGAHARYIKVAAMAVLPLPAGLSFTAGAAISCGTGTAYCALRRLDVSGIDTIAIFGQGPVGLAATQLAKAMGARVIAVDIHSSRLELSKSLGADAMIAASVPADVEQAIRELTHGKGADLALDTSGAASARLSSIRSLKAWGKACLVGEGGELTVDVSNDLLRKQATVLGSWTFSSVLQSECAQFAVDRGVDVDAVFTHRWKLEDAAEAYRLFDSQAGGKGVFVF